MTVGAMNVSAASAEVVDAKYPEILSDYYWYPGDKKADFKLTGESRFYIVIEDGEPDHALPQRDGYPPPGYGLCR